MSDVVHVSFHLDRAERSPETLLRAWPSLPGCAIAAARSGVDVAVVQPAASDTILERDGVSFHFVRERPGLRRGPAATRPVTERAPALTRVVNRLRPRLLHVHGLSLPGHARALAQRTTGAKLLMQDHADGLPRAWRRAAARRDFARCDAVAFTAAAQARPFFDAGLFPSGLPVHEVIEASVAFDPSFDVPARSGPVSFVWLGRLDPNKDPLTVLDGLAGCLDLFPGARLRMCWPDAPLLRIVRERVTADRRLASRVDLLGQCAPDEVRKLLLESDFLLQGSHREGSGYAVIEALACGVTPIVTSLPSFRAIAGDTGFFWEPGDSRTLATCLRRVAAQDRDSLRRSARERFDRHLSWDAVGRQLASTYESLLSRKDDRSRHTVEAS